MNAAKPKIIDGDGHVFEDMDAILDLMPPRYKKRPQGRDLFPPLDHLHSANLHDHPPGAFTRVGPDGWLHFLDDVGIEMAVLYTTRGLAFGKVVSRDWAIDLARAYNDWLYQTYLKRSSRFQGIALLPLQEPEAAVEELRRAVEELGMCGAMLPSTGIQFNLGHKIYWPIYAEANRLRCCLGVHGGAHEKPGNGRPDPLRSGPRLGPSFRPNDLVCGYHLHRHL